MQRVSYFEVLNPKVNALMKPGHSRLRDLLGVGDRKIARARGSGQLKGNNIVKAQG